MPPHGSCQPQGLRQGFRLGFFDWSGWVDGGEYSTSNSPSTPYGVSDKGAHRVESGGCFYFCSSGWYFTCYYRLDKVVVLFCVPGH